MKDEAWNFSAALIDAAGWGLGMGLISDSTFLPLFVHRLTASPLAIGAISSVMTFGWFMPGILVAGPIDRLPRVKSYVMAVVKPEERLAMAGVTSLVRSGGWAIAPAIAGVLMQTGGLAAPLVAAAALKLSYDALLWREFRRVRPPEETAGSPR